MPSLNFQGKDLALLALDAQKEQLLVPDHKNSLTGNVSLEDNLIVHGDCLSALGALAPSFAESVKCAYIDPPYNTGYEGWVFNDNAASTAQNSGGGDRHDKWLAMMYPRLQAIHRLLAPNGVLFVSIDDNELAHLILMLNEIFGNENHIATLVWNSPQNDLNRGFDDASGIHEYVVVYAKNILSEGVFAFKKGSPSENVKQTVAKGMYDQELSWPMGTGTPSLICDNLSTTDGINECAQILGEASFDYPKPSAFIEYLIQQVTTNESIILDCFAGSGTTAQAVLNLNNKDGGTRRFILIEAEDYASTVTAERVRRVIKGVPQAQDEKLRKGVAGTFSFFNLGDSKS